MAKKIERKNMIIIKNPLVIPVGILIWLIDISVWLAFVMLILKQRYPSGKVFAFWGNLTRPVLNTIERFLSQYIGYRHVPEWTMWLITIIGLVILRHILTMLILN